MRGTTKAVACLFLILGLRPIVMRSIWGDDFAGGNLTASGLHAWVFLVGPFALAKEKRWGWALCLVGAAWLALLGGLGLGALLLAVLAHGHLHMTSTETTYATTYVPAMFVIGALCLTALLSDRPRNWVRMNSQKITPPDGPSAAIDGAGRENQVETSVRIAKRKRPSAGRSLR